MNKTKVAIMAMLCSLVLFFIAFLQSDAVKIMMWTTAASLFLYLAIAVIFPKRKKKPAGPVTPINVVPVEELPPGVYYIAYSHVDSSCLDHAVVRANEGTRQLYLVKGIGNIEREGDKGCFEVVTGRDGTTKEIHDLGPHR